MTYTLPALPRRCDSGDFRAARTSLCHCSAVVLHASNNRDIKSAAVTSVSRRTQGWLRELSAAVRASTTVVLVTRTCVESCRQSAGRGGKGGTVGLPAVGASNGDPPAPMLSD